MMSIEELVFHIIRNFGWSSSNKEKFLKIGRWKYVYIAKQIVTMLNLKFCSFIRIGICR